MVVPVLLNPPLLRYEFVALVVEVIDVVVGVAGKDHDDVVVAEEEEGTVVRGKEGFTDTFPVGRDEITNLLAPVVVVPPVVVVLLLVVPPLVVVGIVVVPGLRKVLFILLVLFVDAIGPREEPGLPYMIMYLN